MSNIKAMNGDTRVRVYNRCNHDIGVYVNNGQQSINIKSGNAPVSLTVNDVLYIDGICNRKKFFSSGMLTIESNDGVPLTLEDIGGFTDMSTEIHYDSEEIESSLKKPLNAFKAWLAKIDDPVEIHAIWEIGKNMDLPASKLKLLQAKMPNKDLLESDSESE